MSALHSSPASALGRALADLPPPQDWPLFLAQPALPPQFNLYEWLLGADALARFGARTALIGVHERLSYAALAARCELLATALVGQGIGAGSRVLLYAPNSPMLGAAVLALWRQGAQVLLCGPMLRRHELAKLRARFGPGEISLMLCDPDLLPEWLAACEGEPPPTLNLPPDALSAQTGDLWQLAQAGRDLPAAPLHAGAPDDICLLAQTSGSSGQPKLCAHDQRALFAICDYFPRHLQLHADDVCSGTPSLAFTYGLGGLLLFPLAHGAAALLGPHLPPAAFWQRARDCGATLCFSSPLFYRQLARLDLPPARLRLAISAGEALPQATRQAFQDASHVPLLDALGATEMLHVFIAGPASGQAAPPGALGRALPPYRVAVLDQAGQACAPGVPGRLAVQGPSGCRYWREGDSGRQGEYVQQAWNLSGDAAHMDAQGWIFFHGRCDDLLVLDGHNLAPLEVELLLQGQPEVAQAAVCLLPEAQRGQILAALLVLQEGAVWSAALEQDVRRRLQVLAAYKMPRRWLTVAALPRNQNGKLQRRLLPAAAQSVLEAL
ncbi:AMP-binding protein [Massilia sp. W12]|uniref:acyl-CoA synthetase n=1 Tax=Massilia sp. W12 TaxID=3126507 RepID=UPI0030CE2234